MLDARAIKTHYNEPTTHCYRFAGAGTGVPTAIANVPDASRATVTRSAIGTLSLNTNENVGYVQYYDANVHQPPGTVGKKTVFVTPPAALTYPISFACQVVYMSNGANVDLAVGEELVFTVERTDGRP
jgi:hypothetical protein